MIHYCCRGPSTVTSIDISEPGKRRTYLADADDDDKRGYHMLPSSSDTHRSISKGKFLMNRRFGIPKWGNQLLSVLIIFNYKIALFSRLEKIFGCWTVKRRARRGRSFINLQTTLVHPLEEGLGWGWGWGRPSKACPGLRRNKLRMVGIFLRFFLWTTWNLFCGRIFCAVGSNQLSLRRARQWSCIWLRPATDCSLPRRVSKKSWFPALLPIWAEKTSW